VILYAMLTGQLPWTKRNQQQLFEQIRRGLFTIPAYLSDSCRNLIQGLMNVDVAQRLTIDAALKHPWVLAQSVSERIVNVATQPSLRRLDSFFEREVSAESLDGAEDCRAYDESQSVILSPDQLERSVRPRFVRGVFVRRFPGGNATWHPMNAVHHFQS
jgi:serine/threonine protein kinase